MTGRVVSMPMYDLPEVRATTTALWEIIVRYCRREGLTDIPSTLVHDRPVRQLWTDENMVFSQCCGYDLIHRYKDQFSVLATPCYSAPGCGGSDYASVIVVNEDSQYDDVLEMHGEAAVINGPESQSGANSLFFLVAPKCSDGKFFSKIVTSGSHDASLAMIQRNQADVAAIDCITYALLRRFRPAALAGTRCLGFTYTAPAPPYITRKEQRSDFVRQFNVALCTAFADPTFRTIGQDIYLSAVEEASSVDYNQIVSYVDHNDWIV